MRGQRVVLCAPGFPTSSDDADKPFLLDHAIALAEAGLQVTVVSPAVSGAPSRQTIDGVKVHRVRYAPRRLETLATTGSMYKEAAGIKALLVLPMIASMVFSAVRELRRGTTVAYGHWWIPGGVVAVIAAGLARRPSFVHLHGSDSHVAQSKAMKFFARWVLRRADICLAVSQQLAEWGRALSGREVSVLPMPLRVSSSSSLSSVSSNEFVLGVGRLVHEKGFDVLVEAVGALDPPRRPKIVIIGVGPERQSLLHQAVALDVDLDLPGAVPPDQLRDWYSRATIVAVPSRREGFGLVAAEAAAAGRAVVGSAVGGIPEIVENGVSGLIVEADDVTALSRALLEVDPAWGARGPARVETLSPKRHGAFVRQLYDDVRR